MHILWQHLWEGILGSIDFTSFVSARHGCRAESTAVASTLQTKALQGC